MMLRCPDLADLVPRVVGPTLAPIATFPAPGDVRSGAAGERLEADDFVIENGGKQLVLYRDAVCALTARRVVAARFDVRDIISIEERR